MSSDTSIAEESLPHFARPGDEMGRLPLQPVAAQRILALVSSANASAADVGALVGLDPVLSARVLKLAHSAAYAGHGNAESVSRAVVLLGNQTVKALAAACATRLFSDDVALGPPNFWTHSVTTAHGAEVAAALVGADRRTAFSAGLMHDIGTALLQQRNPSRYSEILESVPRGQLLAAESRAFGIDHAQLGADALSSWGFPASIVDAVADHHASPVGATKIVQAVILGHAVAERIEPLFTAEPTENLEDLVIRLGFNVGAIGSLLKETSAALEAVRRRIEGP